MSFLQIKAFSIDSTDSFTFGNANVTTTLNGNIANFTGNLTSLNANLGNLAVANYFQGNGSLLTSITGANVTGTVSAATTAGTVTTAAQPNITSVGTLTSLDVSGNLTTGNISGGNLVSANYFTGTLTTAAQPNITSLGTLTGLTVNGDITGTGNLIVAGTVTYVNSTITDIKDPLIELGGGANGAALSSDDGLDRGTLLHYYNTGGSVAVDAFMGWKNSTGEFTFASNVSQSPTNQLTINQLGNIKAGNANLGNLVTSNYFSGNGSLLTSITGANVTGTVSSATSATSATTAGTVTTAAQPNITSVGTLTGLTSTGTIDFTGTSNVSLGSISNLHIGGGSAGYVLQTDGSGGLSWHSMTAGTGNANISGSNTQIFFNDNGSNTLGASANLTFDSSTKTLTVDNIVANGSGLTSLTGGNVTGQVGNALVAGTVYTASQPNITSVGTLTSLTVSGVTNLGAVGNVTITGGTANYVLKTDGSGVLSWVAQKSLNSTVDEFTGDGSTVNFTLTATPTSKNYTFASIQGVMQPKSSYSVSGTTITFSTAPPNTALIEVTTLGLS